VVATAPASSPAPKTAPARGAPKPAPQVDLAVSRAPGLDDASPQDILRLRTLLTEGVCTHDALTSVFATVNRQTLVSLVRELGRC
jgi:hypothetical protein